MTIQTCMTRLVNSLARTTTQTTTSTCNTSSPPCQRGPPLGLSLGSDAQIASHPSLSNPWILPASSGSVQNASSCVATILPSINTDILPTIPQTNWVPTILPHQSNEQFPSLPPISPQRVPLAQPQPTTKAQQPIDLLPHIPWNSTQGLPQTTSFAGQPTRQQIMQIFGPKPVRKPRGPLRTGDQQQYEEYLEYKRASDRAYAQQCKERQARRATRFERQPVVAVQAPKLSLGSTD